MAEQINNYQCPACTGPLHFDGATGKLACEYCDSSFTVEEIEALYAKAEADAVEAHNRAETDWDTSDLEQWGVEEGMKAYNCPSCGAQLVCDETTAATACPYCGNPSIIPGQFAGSLKPDCMIPFKLDQAAAKKALENHYKGKKFLPDGFASKNRIREIQGVYVPFWLFDGEVDADVSFRGENVRSYVAGEYQITEIDHYLIRRAGTVPFQKIPVDASTNMPDNHMDAIEPYDYSALCDYSAAYLPGFLANKYDVSAEDCALRADQRAANTTMAAMRGDVSGYASCVMTGHQLSLRRGKVHYGLLPVYMLNTKWEGNDYLFAMNGQTGKLIGDLPVDRGKYWKWFLGITAGVTAILGTLLLFIL